jgi:hypothetical protein
MKSDFLDYLPNPIRLILDNASHLIVLVRFSPGRTGRRGRCIRTICGDSILAIILFGFFCCTTLVPKTINYLIHLVWGDVP